MWDMQPYVGPDGQDWEEALPLLSRCETELYDTKYDKMFTSLSAGWLHSVWWTHIGQC